MSADLIRVQSWTVSVCTQKSVQKLLICIFPLKKPPEALQSFLETDSKERPSPSNSKRTQSQTSDETWPSFVQTGSKLSPDEMMAKMLYQWVLFGSVDCLWYRLVHVLVSVEDTLVVFLSQISMCSSAHSTERKCIASRVIWLPIWARLLGRSCTCSYTLAWPRSWSSLSTTPSPQRSTVPSEILSDSPSHTQSARCSSTCCLPCSFTQPLRHWPKRWHEVWPTRSARVSRTPCSRGWTTSHSGLSPAWSVACTTTNRTATSVGTCNINGKTCTKPCTIGTTMPPITATTMPPTTPALSPDANKTKRRNWRKRNWNLQNFIVNLIKTLISLVFRRIGVFYA